MFRRKNRIWHKARVCKASSVTSQETRCRNKIISIKDYSIPRELIGWKLQTDDWVCGKRTTPVFFFFLFSFFYQPHPGLGNCKSVFLILKISQYGVSRRWVQLFSRYPCKNLYLHFYKTYDHEIRQAGITTGFDSNKTNKAGAGNVITSRLRDKLKTYLHCQSNHDHQTWQDGNLSSWEAANNVTQPFNHVIL